MSFDPPGKKKALPLSAENAPTIIRPSAMQHHDVAEANSRNEHLLEPSHIYASTRQSHQHHMMWDDESTPSQEKILDVDERQQEEKEEEGTSCYDEEDPSAITITTSSVEPKIRVLGVVKKSKSDEDSAVRERFDSDQSDASVDIATKSKTDDDPAVLRERIDPENAHVPVDNTTTNLEEEEHRKISFFFSWSSRRTKIALGLLGVFLMLGILYVVYFVFVL